MPFVGSLCRSSWPAALSLCVAVALAHVPLGRGSGGRRRRPARRRRTSQPPPPPGRVRVPTSHANVHAGPSTGAVLLVMAPKGTTLTVTGRDKEWVQVELTRNFARPGSWCAGTTTKPAGGCTTPPWKSSSRSRPAPIASARPGRVGKPGARANAACSVCSASWSWRGARRSTSTGSAWRTRWRASTRRSTPRCWPGTPRCGSSTVAPVGGCARPCTRACA